MISMKKLKDSLVAEEQKLGVTKGHLVMVQCSTHPYLHEIITFFCINFYKVKAKGFNF